MLRSSLSFVRSGTVGTCKYCTYEVRGHQIPYGPLLEPNTMVKACSHPAELILKQSRHYYLHEPLTYNISYSTVVTAQALRLLNPSLCSQTYVSRRDHVEEYKISSSVAAHLDISFE